MDTDRRLAEAQLFGALAYGQLCAHAVTAAATLAAPDLERAERMVAFARAELAGYERLRAHVDTLTDLGPNLLERQKPAFDEFFGAVPNGRWVDVMAFFAFALPLAADFARAVAPTLDPTSSEVLLATLAGREAFEQFAHDEVHAHLDAGGEHATAELRSVVAELLGRALTGFQAVVADSDALEVLMRPQLAEAADPDAVGADRAKGVAMAVLDAHRRRMHAIGLDDLA